MNAHDLRRFLLPAVAAIATLASTPATPAHAEREAPLPKAAGPGLAILAPDDESPAEVVTLAEEVAPMLLALPPEAEIRLADWPVGPEQRADVALTRHEIYAPDARVFVVERGGLREVPRSALAFYWGEVNGDPEARVFVSVDPASGEISGFTSSPEGHYELRPVGVSPTTGRPRHLVTSTEALRAAETGGEEPEWTCGQEDLPHELSLSAVAASSQLGRVSAAAITSLHRATIAVDTDNELLGLKFANNTAATTSYIANLIASMSVMYERDLLVRLQQGTTFLRVSSTPDAYNQPCAAGTYPCTNAGGASPAQLNEFSNYWAGGCGGTCTGVQRALAMMLSGKQSSNNSSSGIAWIGNLGGSGLCSTGSGYSFTQVFKFAQDTSASDTRIVGHELGHNFGSPHTHCYSPPVDACTNVEGPFGCYSGAPSCPAAQTMNGVANVRGSVMSYCHQLGGCSSSSVFHPTSVALLAPIVQSRVGSCIFPLATAPAVGSIVPKSGSTAGGTQVTLTGASFLAGATVSIGGAPATGVSVTNGGTRITATTGARATGVASVTVTNPGGQSGTLSNAYFYTPPPATTSFYTVTPCRLFDTRNPNGSFGGPALAAGQQRSFTITGRCGIPADAKSISANVTIVTPGGSGFLEFFPGNAFPFGTSAINFAPGQVRANNAMLTLATDGTGRLTVVNTSGAATHAVLDVNGYFR